MNIPVVTPLNRKWLPNACKTDYDMFSVFAVVAFAVVFAGFARTFFLRFLFASPRMPTYLYVHGLLFSSWYALFFVQTRLVAFHRVDLHRRVGILAAALAGLAVPVALGVAILGGRRVYETRSRPFVSEG